MIRFFAHHFNRRRRPKIISACFARFILVLTVFGFCGCAGLTENQTPASPAEENPTSGLSSPLAFFRKYISSADGDRCPMHPSCSTYSSEAFQKHGPILGWIMTTDRLMRCERDELDRSPRIQKGGQVYCHDPVENNDFWW